MFITTSAMALYLIILIIPFAFFFYLGLEQKKDLLISIVRLVVQLAFVGIYLKYIFTINNLFLNLLWVVVMLFTATFAVKNRSGIKLSYFFLGVFLSLLFTLSIMFCLLLMVFPKETLTAARYMIPIFGMILGNAMRGSIIAVSHFNENLMKKESEYIHYIFLGASYNEALKPFVRDSFKYAISPNLASMATIGLVSLPGMMTGQMLGGSDPALAVKYQIMITISIFTAVSISSFVLLNLLSRLSINKFGMLKHNSNTD